MDKFDLSEFSKKYALENLKHVIETKLDTTYYLSDYNKVRYRDSSNWLSQGDIIKFEDDYFIYLGYSEPKNWPVFKLRHHLYNVKGKRLIWDLGINLSIQKII